MKTQVSEILRIRYPIIQGGMQWVGTAELTWERASRSNDA